MPSPQLDRSIGALPAWHAYCYVPTVLKSLNISNPGPSRDASGEDAVRLRLTRAVQFCDPSRPGQSAQTRRNGGRRIRLALHFRQNLPGGGSEADQEWQRLWATHQTELTEIAVYLGDVDA